MPSLPALTLTYFDSPGRAQVIRTTFNLAGVPFHDERLSRAEFEARKASFPYGKVPVLRVNGETVAETQPILRYVGRLTGMYPPASAPVACAMVDEILDSFDDLFERILLPTMVEQDREKKKAMQEQTAKHALPQALARIDHRLEATNKTTFFAEAASTTFVHHVLAALYADQVSKGLADYLSPTFMDAFPSMRSCQERVAAMAHASQGPPKPPVDGPIPRPRQVTLSYFDMPGRAEPARLALHVGGIPFTDERVSYLDYLDRKASLPNGNLPVLQADGQVIAQSASILRYAGMVSGLYPAQDALLAAKVDEVTSHISELYYAFDPWFGESDATTKRALGEKIAATTVHGSLQTLDTRIGQWRRGKKESSFALGGDTPTIADLAIYTLLKFLQTDFAGQGDKAPTTKITRDFEHLTEIYNTVGNHPRVVNWYANRIPAVA